MARRIARPLLVYAGVVSLGLGVGLVTLASGSLIRVARVEAEPERKAEAIRREVRVLVASAVGGSALAALVLAFLSSRLVVSPIRGLGGRSDDGDDANEVERVVRGYRTTLRALEAERSELQAKNEALERLQQSLVRASTLASVGRLAAGVAHEVGNPLAAVMGYLRLLELDLAPEERRDALQRSSRELDRIHQTIQRLLAFARANPEALTLGAFAADELARDVIELGRKHPALDGATITLRLDDGLPAAWGSAQSTRQILLNLLINAGQATRGRAPRSVEVHVARADGGGLRLCVHDDGPGVPDANRESIFDPFFTTKDDGTGLGLAVSRALAERMDGSLELAPSEVGARFVLSLPAPPEVAAAPADAEAAP